MYVDHVNAYRFINYELPLNRGTATPYLLGTSANLNHVTTTNARYTEKFINRKGFIYKDLLPQVISENGSENSISSNLTDFGGGWRWSKNQ